MREKGKVLMDSFAVLTKSTPSERKRESSADLFEADFPGGRHGFSRGCGKSGCARSTDRCATKCNQSRDRIIKAELKLLPRCKSIWQFSDSRAKRKNNKWHAQP